MNFVLILVVIKICGCITFYNATDKVQVELDCFMDSLKNCPILQSHTCYYTGSDSSQSKDVQNSFIIKNHNCGILILNENITRIGEKIAYEVKNFFIFLDSVEEIADAAAELIQNAFWRPKSYCFFIVTNEVEDTSFLNASISYIWSKNILNFLLVFVHQHYQVYAFFPFAEDKIISIKDKINICTTVALDKVKNFNRNPLRASFYPYPPKMFKKNGQWTGIDFEVFLLLTEMLNASVKTLPTPTANDTVQNLYSNKADIFLIKLFQVHFYTNISFSYTYEMDDRVAMVPKPSKIPAYQHILYIFDLKTWLVLLLTIILLQIIFFIASYWYCVNLDYFIMVWSPLLNLGIPNSLINKAKPQLLLLIWIFSCLVLGASLQTSLIGSFVRPIYEKSVKTIEDLRAKQMKIYVHPFLTQPSMMPESLGLQEFYSYMDIPESIQRIEERNISGAFVMSRQFARYYINEHTRRYGDPVYEIVEEALVPGSMVFLLQKTSPFLDRIDKCLLLIQQHALLRENSYKSAVTQEQNILELYHFLVIFYILILGYLVGFVILLLEKYIYKVKHV